MVKGIKSKQELGVRSEELGVNSSTSEAAKPITSFLIPHYSLLILFAIVAVITSCSSIDCKLNGSVYCRYQLKDQYLNDVAFAYPLTVTLCDTDSGDIVVINNESNASAIDLPMSHGNATDVLKFTITVTDTIVTEDTVYYVTTPHTDIIRVTKTNEPYFESIDCAPRYNHTIEAVQSSHNFIDSLVINNKKVTNDASKENIYIFLNSGN